MGRDAEHRNEPADSKQLWEFFLPANQLPADPNGRAVQGVGLGPLACWDCGFEFSRGYGYLSLVLCVVR